MLGGLSMRTAKVSYKTIQFLILFAILIPLLAGCGGGGGNSSNGNHGMADYLNDPNYPQEFFTTATPEEVGMDSHLLADCTSLSSNIHSILVVRNDRLIFEVYGKDGGRQLTPDDQHIQYCATKAIISALAGIAIQDGTIKSLQDPVIPYFINDVIANISPTKRLITVEDLLTMRSGLTQTSDEEIMSADEAGLVALNKPMWHKPGSTFVYNDYDPCVLNSLLYRATGQTPENYAKEKLFGPLGITDFHWIADKKGVSISWQLYLRPRDMAKFGYLFLKQGMWKDTQVVPASWVTTSTQSHVITSGHGGFDYGYYWWLAPYGGYQALGINGQRIMVFPDKNLIITFTANAPEDSVIDKIAQKIVKSIQ